MRYIVVRNEQINKRMRAFNEYYSLLREAIEKGNLKSSLDRGAFTHPRQILNRDIINSLGLKRHRISLGYGQEVGEDIVRKKIVERENLIHGTDYKLENVALVAGAWFGVEVVIEEIVQKFKNKKTKIAVIGPTHYQLFQRPIEVLGLEIVGFDFVNFKGSTPKTKEEIDQILKCKPDVVFVTNPNNPIGEYFPSDLLKYLVSTCKIRNIFVIIDEMQNFLPAEGKKLNYAKWIQSKNVVRIDSFSKHYALAEYRVGWVIADKSIIGSRYTGITQHVRGLMGNAPRAANDAIVKLLDIEINEIKNKVENPLRLKIKGLYKKENYIIKLLAKNPKIEIIHRDACFNLTIRIKDFPNDIEMSRQLMDRGTLIMPCTGYGYRTEDVVMRITFAERWSRIKHSMTILTDILNKKK